MSPDEARILTYLKNNEIIPCISIKRLDLEGMTTYIFVVKNATDLLEEVTLNFPNNLNLYLDNLESLGIITQPDYFYTTLEDRFQKLEANFQNLYNSYKKIGDTDEQHQQRKSVHKAMYLLTGYGKLFIKACIQN